jgi:hypothetical protein
MLLRFTVSGYLGHCIACASEIYGFWLPWSLYYLYFLDLRFLVTLVIVLPVLLRFTASGGSIEPLETDNSDPIPNLSTQKHRQYTDQGNQKP